jgi:tetratricopeptide (TPR) repeat protein
MAAPRGLLVSVYSGRPSIPSNAIEVDVGSKLPIAFTGIKRCLEVLAELAPEAAKQAREAHPAEWHYLFSDSPPPAGADLFELASAPNQRRLYRESEQVFRVLNFAAHSVVDGLRALRRPLLLRHAGSCDLVSLRGLMHAVEYSRLDLEPLRERLIFGEWQAHATAARPFADTRRLQLEQLLRRMGVAAEPGSGASALVDDHPIGKGLEGAYMSQLTDANGSLEYRLAAALLAVRACFFSTNYEGSVFSIETALSLLRSSNYRLDQGALASAWMQLDRPALDIPMLELDEGTLGDGESVLSLLRLHLGVIRVFCGELDDALTEFGRALTCRITPERIADVHLYRAATMTKRLGQVQRARGEIGRGLDVLRDRPRATAALPTAWLHNLHALTHFQEKRWAEARAEEELALIAIDGVSGDSATHLKTNLISNLSVLAESEGDLPRALQIWRLFEPLNQKIGSAHAAKVHAYRMGALYAKNGQRSEALAAYQTAIGHADATGDTFHGEAIAATIGRLFLADGRARSAPAEHWYQCAAERARSAGDSLALAKDMAGQALARGERDFSAPLAMLSLNATHDLTALTLPSALGANDRAAVLAALPFRSTKLTRPFAQINV